MALNQFLNTGLRITNYEERTNEEIEGIVKLHIKDVERVRSNYKFDSMRSFFDEENKILQLRLKFLIQKKNVHYKKKK